MHLLATTRGPASLAALATCGALAALVPASAHAQERHSLSGNSIAIYNLAGEVRVEGGAGSDVLVEITRGGSEARQLRVQTGQLGGRNSLRVIYPGDRIVYPGVGRGSTTDMRVAEDGSFGRGSGRRVRISGSGDGLQAHADLVVRIPAGRDVELHLGAGSVAVSNVDGRLLVNTASAAVTATNTRGRLKVDVGSGAVRVERAEGDVEVDTGSGNVQVAAIRGERLLVDTGSGRVNGADLRVGSLEVDTGSGSVELRDVSSRRARVDTGSGSVHMSVLTDVDDLEIDTGSGRVTLRVPAALGAEVEIDTGSGGIDIDVPVEARVMKRDEFRGRIGDGQGRIRIDTGSGSVRIQRG